ncbi:HAD family hydrolase [Enterococcus sp. AZ126]|uniref:HAD family hydrolase n=1 Tax=Enterococcus sp. AZ126 TaxID=2774635 RepID=UPI003F21D70E
MQYKTIVFDLDGTITDSGDGIIHSVLYALNKMHVKKPDKHELESFIGPPLKDSFINICQLDDTSADQAVGYYRDYYQAKGMYENHIYEGIPTVLTDLKQKGCTLYVATSKPEIYAKQILAHFDLDQYFTGIYGASLDGIRSKKGDVIHYALKEAQLTKLEKTIMIGDRSHDIVGAKENKLASIGVLYGFGDRVELETAGADYIAVTTEELKEIITKSK